MNKKIIRYFRATAVEGYQKSFMLHIRWDDGRVEQVTVHDVTRVDYPPGLVMPWRVENAFYIYVQVREIPVSNREW